MPPTNGPDVLVGTNGADAIDGRGGDDVIFGHATANGSANAGIIQATRVGTGFQSAVFASSAPGDPDRLYVIEKDLGRISILDLATGDSTVFLDIPNGELTTLGEQGLLSLAFHPDYATNGRLFVHMVNDDGDLELREYHRSNGDPDVADAAPVQTIITVPHPTNGNHNGGTVAFGPDGYLYYSLGDGGSGGDPPNNAQNLNSLLGKILRLDVDNDDFPADDDQNYAIPDGNPFAGATPGADEIWAYGLRNPWRMSFDSVTGDLYIGDVGQNAIEEIDFQPTDSTGGENYGWRVREGTSGPLLNGATDPVFEYGHDVGNSVTGGLVYRGTGASLVGSYFFADFASGRIWTLRIDGSGEAVEVSERTSQIVADEGAVSFISSFGSDGDGNLYVVTLGGDIFRLTPTALAADLDDRLEGGDGNDRLYGGAGNDRLFGDADDDRLRGGFGEDRLFGGGDDDRLFGDAGDDRLLGNSGNDRLAGGRGNDRLTGGGGRDLFLFDAALDADANVDDIADFGPGDRIGLDRSVFAALDPGGLAARHFETGAADDANDFILYRRSTGEIFYDDNGDAGGGRTLFARVDAGTRLAADDFVVIG